MNEKKICFISCVNDHQLYKESLYYINQLEIPEGYEIECICVEDAISMTQGYNKAMKESDAKYKVYLHQDVYIINKYFIKDTLDIFNSDDKIGMLGMAGAKSIPTNGVWWESTHKYGEVYESHTGKMELLQFNEVTNNYEEVKAIDGLIMITQYDISWREDIFDGWHFYDISQSVEFTSKGYKVVIPEQNEVWCIHDCGILNVKNGYEHYRNVFLEAYSKSIINNLINDIKKNKVLDEDAIQWRNYYTDKTNDKEYVKPIDNYLLNTLNLHSEKSSVLFDFDKIKALEVVKNNEHEFSKYTYNAKISLDNKNYEEASRWCFEGAKYASENHPGFYTSNELESILIECAKNLPNYDVNVNIPSYYGKKKKVLHILSEGYSTGGHTRLIKNWVEKDKDSIHSAITTWQMDSIPDWLTNAIEKSGGWLHSLQSITNFIDSAYILRKIAYEWADIVVLHIHMYDPIPIMAFGVEGGPSVLFMNHADHVFWIGSSIVDRLVDFRSAGMDLSSRRRNVDRNSILPLPLNIPENLINNRRDLRKKLGISDNAVVLLTIASEHKFKSFGKIHYIDIMKKVISDNKNALLIVIGPNNTGIWEKAYNDTNKRIIALGVQKDVNEYYAMADIYVDSYMLGSVTSALEGGLYELPIVTLQNYNNQTLSFNDMASECLTNNLNNVEEFINYINILINNSNYRKQEGKNISDKIKNNHVHNWKNTLDSIYNQLENTRHNIYLRSVNYDNFGNEDLFLALFQNSNKKYKEVIDEFNNLFENKFYKESLQCLNKFYEESFGNINKDLKIQAKLYKVNTVKDHCIKNRFKYVTVEEEKKREVFVPHYYNDFDNEKIIKGVSPDIYISELENVFIIGENSCIVAEDYCLYDIARNDRNNRYDLKGNSILNIDDNYAIINAIDSNIIIKKAICLVGCACYNYYHFTVEILSRLQYIDCYKEYRGLPIIVDEVIKTIPQYSELLNKINKYNHEIIYVKKNYICKVKKLIYPSYNTWMPINLKSGIKFTDTDQLISQSAISYIRSSVLKEERNNGFRKIFISRKNTANSRLINEVDVINLFKLYGFEIVYPEELSFEEQVRIFSEAEYVAGASGAAFTNIVYCPSNAKIMCIVPKEYNFYIYSTISKFIGLQCIFLDAEIITKAQVISSEQFKSNLNYCEECLRSLKLCKKNNKEKEINQKIKIVFFVQHPSVWSSTESVWKAFKSDDRCDVEIVQLPFYHHNYDQKNNKSIGDYLVEKEIPFIYWYEYNLDDKNLDIVFFQNSYDGTRPLNFSIENISKCCNKIVYIPYAFELLKKWAGTEKDYIQVISESNLMKECWKIFLRSNRSKCMYEKFSLRGSSHMVVSGHPKIDYVVNYKKSKFDIIKSSKKYSIIKDRRIILWNPNISEFGGQDRWSLYFDILDLMEKYNDVIFIIRPHPLQLIKLKDNNVSDDYIFEKFKNKLNKLDNLILDDSSDYREAFTLSDALLTCSSSLIFEYLATKKPILHTPQAYETELNEDREILSYLYKGEEIEQIDLFFNNIFEGKDPMKNVRMKIISEFLYAIDGKNGERIKEYVIRKLKEEKK